VQEGDVWVLQEGAPVEVRSIFEKRTKEGPMNQMTAILVTSLAAGAAAAGCSVAVAEQEDLKQTQQRDIGIELDGKARECSDECYSWECDRYTCDARSVQYDESCCTPVGRPLIVDGTTRVAMVEEREDWV
jgi:hypothetical protein